MMSTIEQRPTSACRGLMSTFRSDWDQHAGNCDEEMLRPIEEIRPEALRELVVALPIMGQVIGPDLDPRRRIRRFDRNQLVARGHVLPIDMRQHLQQRRRRVIRTVDGAYADPVPATGGQLSPASGQVGVVGDSPDAHRGQANMP